MMPTQLIVFFMTISALLSLIITVQSSLVVAVLGREWVQVKRLSPLDMILTTLGITHFCQQGTSVIYSFCTYFNGDYAFWYLMVIWDSANTATFWLTSLLAVFYCAKVSTFTHPIFLWLKWRISRMVPWLLLGSLLFSCVEVIPSTTKNLTWLQIITENSSGNSNVIDRIKTLQKHFAWPQQIVMLAIPFLLFLASMLLLVASLLQHLKQMQQHNTGRGNSSRKAPSTALRSLVIFLICFTSYFLTQFIYITAVQLARDPWFLATQAFIYTVCCIHSTSLMLSSPTLRKFLKLGY